MSSSHNRNPRGVNQYAPVSTADDPALKAALESYHRQGLTSNKKISALLKADYNIDIKDSAVKRRRKELSLMGSRITTATMPYNDALQLIVSEMDDDISGSRGLANVKSRIAFKHGVHLSRDFISEIMHAFDPRGFDHREPGSKKTVRVKKNPLGIHERWAGDGHDKLYSIGFPIWGVVDDASSRWLGAWVVPSNRMGSIVAYLFLCLVEEIGGLPLEFSTDCGSETTQIYGIVNALREMFHADIDPSVLPAHRYVRSVHNIGIERSWLRLRLELGNNAVLAFRRGIDDGIYNSSDTKHHELCQWIWPKLLRQELASFITFRNGVRMRKDKNKAGPSGCSRNEAFSLPESWGGVNCLLPLPENGLAIIHGMKAALGGPALLDFVTPEFVQQAEAAYEELGVTDLTMENVWLVFQDLLPLIAF